MAKKKIIKHRIAPPPPKPKLAFPDSVTATYEILNHEYYVFAGDWENGEPRSYHHPGEEPMAYPAEDVKVFQGDKLLGTVPYDIFTNIYAAHHECDTCKRRMTIDEVEKKVTYDLTQAALDFINDLWDE